MPLEIPRLELGMDRAGWRELQDGEAGMKLLYSYLWAVLAEMEGLP